MKRGDRVRVWPRSAPDQSVDATVLISDDLGLSLAFDKRPPFHKPGMTLASNTHDCTVILIRTMLDG